MMHRATRSSPPCRREAARPHLLSEVGFIPGDSKLPPPTPVDDDMMLAEIIADALNATSLTTTMRYSMPPHAE